MDSHKANESSQELQDLRLIVDWGMGTLIPLTLLFVIVGLVAGSLTIFTVAFDYGLSVIVNVFAFVAIRIMLKKNVFTFPYGVGKLENFTSLLYGALLMPTGGFLIYAAISRFFHPPDDILFEVGQIPMAISLIRSIGLLMMTSRMLRRDPMQTTLISSYFVNYKVAAVTDVGVIISLGLALLFERTHLHGMALMIDPTVTILLAGYMLVNGCRLIVKNFKALMDLPLPEEDQLKILEVLTREYANFEDIGLVYTRRSGNTRFVELELVFDSQTALVNIAEIEQRLKVGMSAYFPDVSFRLIPLTAVMNLPPSR
jgi:cation diffusion facilitator family transporter